MATFKKKSEQLARAKELFMLLDSHFRPVHKLPYIAEQVDLPLRVVKFHAYEAEASWLLEREGIIVAARARASQKLLGRRKARVAGTIESLSDVLYEVRKYNQLMFTYLTAPRRRKGQKATKNSPPRLMIAPDTRADMHKAWMDSLEHVLTLFGVDAIKGQAAELFTPSDPDMPPSPKPVLSFNKPDNAIEAPMEEGEYENTMSSMAGEGKINGPVNYTGPKETSVVEGVEDAVVTGQERPDSES